MRAMRDLFSESDSVLKQNWYITGKVVVIMSVHIFEYMDDEFGGNRVCIHLSSGNFQINYKAGQYNENELLLGLLPCYIYPFILLFVGPLGVNGPRFAGVRSVNLFI